MKKNKQTGLGKTITKTKQRQCLENVTRTPKLFTIKTKAKGTQKKQTLYRGTGWRTLKRQVRQLPKEKNQNMSGI